MAEEKKIISAEDAAKVDKASLGDNTIISHLMTKPKKCPGCGMLNPHTRTACRKCKTALPDPDPTVRCPDCGTELYQTAEKCKYCGLPIDEVMARAQTFYTIEHSHKETAIKLD